MNKSELKQVLNYLKCEYRITNNILTEADYTSVNLQEIPCTDSSTYSSWELTIEYKKNKFVVLSLALFDNEFFAFSRYAYSQVSGRKFTTKYFDDLAYDIISGRVELLKRVKSAKAKVVRVRARLSKLIDNKTTQNIERLCEMYYKLKDIQQVSEFNVEEVESLLLQAK